jgi:hypothetical protein
MRTTCKSLLSIRASACPEITTVARHQLDCPCRHSQQQRCLCAAMHSHLSSSRITSPYMHTICVPCISNACNVHASSAAYTTTYIPSNLSNYKPGVAHPERWSTQQLISTATCIWLAHMRQCCGDACVQAYGTCANSVKWLCMHSTYHGQINRQGHWQSMLAQGLQYVSVQLDCVCSGSANAAPPLRDDSTICSQCWHSGCNTCLCS